MALVVETGAIVPGANSFVTREEFIAYAESVGIEIVDDDSADVLLVKAGIYIASKGSRLKGDIVDRNQPMPYPRENLVLEGFEWNDDEIPRQVKLCQMELALDLNSGIDLYNPPQSGSVGVRRKRVEGAVEIEYAVGDEMKLSRNSTSTALMALLMKGNGLSLVLERA